MGVESLRVAFVAGTLGQGGAEKQLVYMVRALAESGVDVRVYSLTRGEFYEKELRGIGNAPIWVGRFQNPLLRVVTLANALRGFRPHVVQATHFFVNLHASIAGRLSRALVVGSIRNDLDYEFESTGRWAGLSFRLPPVILANSFAARRGAREKGLPHAEKVHVVTNVIDLEAFDASDSAGQRRTPESGTRVTAVARLVHPKRLDRFLEALAAARKRTAGLEGVIVGEGPERKNLERLAKKLGLLPGGVTFLGRRADVPALLRDSHVLALTSDHEGFPNVLLEAMAACLPVVTTPAGDAGAVVVDGETGYVVPFDDIDALTDRLVRMTQSSEERLRLGNEGRRRVEREYSLEGLGDRLLAEYASLARQRGAAVPLPAASS